MTASPHTPETLPALGDIPALVRLNPNPIDHPGVESSTVPATIRSVSPDRSRVVYSPPGSDWIAATAATADVFVRAARDDIRARGWIPLADVLTATGAPDGSSPSVTAPRSTADTSAARAALPPRSRGVVGA